VRLNTKLAKTQLLGGVARTWTALGALLFVLALGGCARTQPKHLWTSEALEAEALHGRGELAEADRRYEELLERAPDESRARWLRHNRAEIALEQGREEKAVAIFRSLRDEGPRDLWGANAAWELAQLAKGSEQRDAMWNIVERFPDEVAAERALEWLENDAEDRSTLEEFALRAESTRDAVPDSMIADYLLFRAAFARETLGEYDEAIAGHARIYELYPDDSLADDALWEMARIYREQQRWQAALPILEKIATDVEASWFVGTYASEWVDESIMLLAEINLLFLENHAEAIRWFEYYVREYPDGFEADDAAWGAVEARRLAGDDAGHFAAMRAFVRDYPTSKWARVARARLGLGGDDDPS
jgi:tetratricopeptide (TPR) repeat protein